MDGLLQYVLSIVTASLICGIVSGIVQDCTGNALIRLVCGLFLLFTVLQPLSGLDLSSLLDSVIPLTEDVSHVTAMGERMADESIADIIKAESEAYILDKAAALSTELNISVTLDEDNIPVSAELHGKVSPYVRQRLENILETDLGITKENQLWTG